MKTKLRDLKAKHVSDKVIRKIKDGLGLTWDEKFNLGRVIEVLEPIEACRLLRTREYIEYLPLMTNFTTSINDIASIGEIYKIIGVINNEHLYHVDDPLFIAEDIAFMHGGEDAEAVQRLINEQIIVDFMRGLC